MAVMPPAQAHGNTPCARSPVRNTSGARIPNAIYYMTGGDTIAALSTAAGEGAIAIVRLSGPRAVEIADAAFRPEGALSHAASHTIHHGHIVEDGGPLDEVLVSVMLAPRTYTREDIVEINCHGGIAPTADVLGLMLRLGARMAEPGEFTRRAFLSGRIDLIQAEATLDVIRARTSAAGRIALEQLSGRLSKRIHAMRDSLLRACAHIEAHIDFPEDGIAPGALAEIAGSMADIEAECRALSESCAEGRLYREGLKVAIVGRPNVGKSSLLNALIGRDRAIVTPDPGTTRDVIEEQIAIRGLPVRIMDTAGMREAHEMAEREGVSRSLRALEDADISLAVLDASVAVTDEDRVVLARVAARPHIVVLNKTDIACIPEVGGIRVSALTTEGIDRLRDAVYAKCTGTQTEGVVVSNLRHKEALDIAAQRLGAAQAAMSEGAPLEVVAIDARDALDSLGRIIGAVGVDDILDIIFREFCIGK